MLRVWEIVFCKHLTGVSAFLSKCLFCIQPHSLSFIFVKIYSGTFWHGFLFFMYTQMFQWMCDHEHFSMLWKFIIIKIVCEPNLNELEIEITICGRQVYSLFHVLMRIYTNMSSFLFVALCVWNWVNLTSFTQGPIGITITKVSVHIVLCERDSRGRNSRLSSFSSFSPSRLFFQTRGLHPPSTLLASTPQGQKAYTVLQSHTVNKHGCSCCLLLPHSS